jgi:hypothetical protein
VRRLAVLATAVAFASCSGSPDEPRPVATLARASTAASPSSVVVPDVHATTIRIGGTPWGIAYGFEAVWAPVGDEVVEINVRSDDVESEVPLDPAITAGSTRRGKPSTATSRSPHLAHGHTSGMACR